MRVTTDTRTLLADPGSRSSVVLDVVNTGQVIDGITGRVIGLPDELVRAHPKLLTLFPDAAGQLTLSLTVPEDHPAGRHPLTVEVLSHGAGEPTQYLDVDLTVSARPAVRLVAETKVVRARRSARFVVQLSNPGNIALDVDLAASDVDRRARVRVTPASVRIGPGAMAPVLLQVRGPRMLTGGEVDRGVALVATARPVGPAGADHADVDPDPAEREPLEATAAVRLRQRPAISRGLLTVLILAGIVALWAAVFLLALTKVFANDPMTKQAPASFFVGAPAGGSANGGSARPRAAEDGSLANAGFSVDAANGAPAGALPKNGQLPPGLGGTITGTVTSTHDGSPVGRILVQAWERGPHGLVLMSSAATQTDGTYSMAGLFPQSYVVEFSATGFHTIWYPAAPSVKGAQLLAVAAQGTTSGVNVVVTGEPATISGTVDPGATLTRVTTTVVARPLTGGGSGRVAAKATTSAAGAYVLAHLPAPGTYELTFTTKGYTANSIIDSVNGGSHRLEPKVTLDAGVGQISGIVTDGTSPLGRVTVSTTVAGHAVRVMTPTTGVVGAYVLGNLPTPATYVITFASKDFGTKTVIVDLKAGQTRSNLDAALAAGTGTVTGVVIDDHGTGVGGVHVSVGGARTMTATAQQTTTLSLGAVGSFELSGLKAPGAYTLIFTRSGYEPTTVPVTLAASGSPPTVRVTLHSQLGSISGAIMLQGAGFVGATVTATNGARSWTVTSSSAGFGRPTGGFLIDALRPGSYSLTVTAPGHAQQTALVVVTAGHTATQTLELGP